MYISEIRSSQIEELKEKVVNNNYGKYLKSLELAYLRGFRSQRVNFDFPVTAIIGPNGGGKTTVLGSAALAYLSVKPGRFFPKSGVADNSMQEWKINYQCIDKTLNQSGLISRISKFNNYKWTRKEVLSRNVLIFGVSRTVPASERTELSRFANSKYSHVGEFLGLGSIVSEEVARILDKDVRDFNYITIADDGRVKFLTGMAEDGNRYSEFHFGAGESSIINLVLSIEEAEENSLVLIEEIENGLHPVATIKLVEYLINVSIRKKIQVIFTTHSDDALLPLPYNAVWCALENSMSQGALDIHSLRTIKGRIEANLVIFVEDDFAKNWIESIINTDNEIDRSQILIYGVKGDGNAIKMHNNHLADPSVSTHSLCFIDGDSEQQENHDNYIFRLPGESPEKYIFYKIKDEIKVVCGHLAVSLHKKYDFQDKLQEVIEQVHRSNYDKHVIFNQIGSRCGFISESVVKSAFLSTWANYSQEEVNQYLRLIKDNLE